MKTLAIELFSDVLCVWAYGAQIRIDQLKADYGERISLKYRFIPLFAAAHQRIERDWKDRDGFRGFNRNVRDVVSRWDHVSVHPDIWIEDTPRSSTVAHLYFKALQQVEREEALSDGGDGSHSRLEEFLRETRRAFFEQARNVSRTGVLDDIASGLDLPLDRMHRLMADGSAHAELHLDSEARDRYQIPGSPTLIFNEGRQRLYGNVGYRIIDANVGELLSDAHHGSASWC